MDEALSTGMGAGWNLYLRGGGTLEVVDDRQRFINRDTRSQAYTDAQVDDYQGLARDAFPWRPPLTMIVRARFSHTCGVLSGTAGFGFWNDPFMMTGRHLPALPSAVWFFYASPPSNMKLDLHTPGHGWKASTIDARRWPFFLLLPTAPLAIPLMNLRPLYRALWPIGQRAIGVSETPLEVAMTDWHTYSLEWARSRARFSVDGRSLLDCDTSPRGPLGFVMWFDNQYAIITPWGRFGYGLLDAPGEQWMEVETLIIEPGQGG